MSHNPNPFEPHDAKEKPEKGSSTVSEDENGAQAEEKPKKASKSKK